MPLSKDPQGGGSEADGSKSTLYCSYCYANGAFVAPDITAEQMQEFVVHKLKEMHYPGFVAKFFAKGIPRLARWQQPSAPAPIVHDAPVVSVVSETPAPSPRDESASGTGDTESA
jgi:hypothetical protein